MSTQPLISVLDSSDPAFQDDLQGLLADDPAGEPSVEATVADILTEVRARGDDAVVSYTNALDGRSARDMAELTLGRDRLAAAAAAIGEDLRRALEFAAGRIRAYHERQKEASWQYVDDAGLMLGQLVNPLDSVGIYVPGGKASYPSSVLMTAVPASVAGVDRIVMTVPMPGGEVSEAVLTAAYLGGVTEAYAIGGAQAVAALAYGTRTIGRVDKIVGPGNAYVATAKRMVFGQVGIDMIAGPSEVVVVADSSADPSWVAMDLFAQAEHAEDARAVLVSVDWDVIRSVQSEMTNLLASMERRSTIEAALRRRGALIKVKDLDEAVEVVNAIAPEHLELCVAAPDGLLDGIRHAGAIFLGENTAEALGDYTAGPSHVLPTSGTARFSSPLGVYDFQKRTSLIGCTGASPRQVAKEAEILALEEGLTAHARSAGLRVTNRGREGTD